MWFLGLLVEVLPPGLSSCHVGPLFRFEGITVEPSPSGLGFVVSFAILPCSVVWFEGGLCGVL